MVPGRLEQPKANLDSIVWTDILHGDVNTQVENLTNLLSLQQEYVPSQSYKSKPNDQPWFGYQCRIAADTKSRAWLRYKSHPSQYNKTLHREACKNMSRVKNRLYNAGRR